jgi:iron complex transport system ATP-binding protein
MSTLVTENLRIAYGATTVVQSLSLTIAPGKVTSLVGRNGCGKSTILRALGRLQRPAAGMVLLDGKAIASQSTRDMARKLAILPQGPTAPEGLTVRALVEQGRYAYRSFLGVRSDADVHAVDQALAHTGMAAFAQRSLDTLSGGQRQRAWIAMALAQETPLLLLDEPTTFLDVAYQLELLELLRRLNQEAGRTVLMVLHDLNQAARYSDQVIAIRDGQIYASGSPASVLTPAMVRDVFGLEADIVVDPRSGAPMFLPYGLTRSAHDNRDGDMALELPSAAALAPVTAAS